MTTINPDPTFYRPNDMRIDRAYGRFHGHDDMYLRVWQYTYTGQAPVTGPESYTPITLGWYRGTAAGNLVAHGKSGRSYVIVSHDSGRGFLVSVNGVFIPLTFPLLPAAQRWAQNIEDVNTES
jgi:hypothetical protein